MTSSHQAHRDGMKQQPREGDTVSGILNLNKPAGPTSHDVVARVRRLAQQRQVGHAGTLDPMATGVLVICLGKATRLIEYLADGRKTYLATVRFGLVTDTWDAEGQVIERHECGELPLGAIEPALAAFRGMIEQVPPMYSALKHDGQPLYRLARQGLTVEREPRRVEIYDLRIMAWQYPDLTLQLECSKGTYVRALAYDLGRAVGAGAHLAALVRLAVGRFPLSEAASLETLEAGEVAGSWKRYLRPLQAALGDMPCAIVDEETARRISFGQQVALDLPEDAELGCAYTDDQRLLAILRRSPRSGLWQPDKVLS